MLIYLFKGVNQQISLSFAKLWNLLIHFPPIWAPFLIIPAGIPASLRLPRTPIGMKDFWPWWGILPAGINNLSQPCSPLTGHKPLAWYIKVATSSDCYNLLEQLVEIGRLMEHLRVAFGIFSKCHGNHWLGRYNHKP